MTSETKYIPKAVNKDAIALGWIVDYSFLELIEKEIIQKYPGYSCPSLDDMENVLRVLIDWGYLKLEQN